MTGGIHHGGGGNVTGRLRGATLFSGIGAPECSTPSIDWRWGAEIDAFPSAVLAHRFPHLVNLGDVSANDFCDQAERAGRPDVLVFGSPCQDFSVAGKRLGIHAPRGNLALVALGIARQLRPEWLVFENVPGLLSSWSGAEDGNLEPGCEREAVENSDFAAFLGVLRECGYLGCYRIYNAEFAGVPQRRRRIFLVAYLGDWRPPAAVLLEPESLSGNPPPGREAGQIAAPTISARPTGGGGLGTDFDLDGGLIAGTVSSKWAKGTGGPSGDECQNLVAAPIAPPVTSNPYGDHESREGLLVAHALRGKGFDASEDGTGRGTRIVAFDCKALGRNGFGVGEISPTLRAMANKDSGANAGGQVAVAFQTSQSGVRIDDVHATLDSNNGPRRHNGALVGSAVRRLTPLECERLQGFPDGWTDIPYRNGRAADGPRYKALGNSMAVPVIGWILDRVQKVDAVLRDLAREAA